MYMYVLMARVSFDTNKIRFFGANSMINALIILSLFVRSLFLFAVEHLFMRLV